MRSIRPLLAALLLALDASAAAAQTTRTPLSQGSWSEICAAPCSVAVLSGIAGLVVGTAPPASLDVPAVGWTPENGLFPNANAGSRVYARAISAGSSIASIPGTTSSTGSPTNAFGSTMTTPMMFSRIPSAATGTNMALAKAGAGRASSYQGCNTTASTIYMRVYDAASVGAVSPGSTPVLAGPYAFPANTCAPATNFAGNAGVMFSNGLVYAFGISPEDGDATGIDAGSITAFQLGYQ